MIYLLTGLVVAVLVLQVILLTRRESLDTGGLERGQERTERVVREEIARNREESGRAIERLSVLNQQKLDEVRGVVDQRLQVLAKENTVQLEKMRVTVDEKLQGTLEKRLGESFKLVSEQLAAVQKGLGEMQKLAGDVGSLQKVLSNVKVRGIWGEYQLAQILEQILTPEQYAANVCTKEGSRETVEFAVKLPGKDEQNCVWLPIDAKFPKEDYERLITASEQGDPVAVAAATKALLAGVEKMAKDISEKYIHPPVSTDFAILFLPTEGLYAEVLREPGFHDKLQHRYHVLPAGPTTLAALLNSLRVGFQTLAIEQRSHEVWMVLGAVKREFGKFGDVLEKVKRQLHTASKTLDETGVRTRALERSLREVEALPEDTSVSRKTIVHNVPLFPDLAEIETEPEE